MPGPAEAVILLSGMHTCTTIPSSSQEGLVEPCRRSHCMARRAAVIRGQRTAGCTTAPGARRGGPCACRGGIDVLNRALKDYAAAEEGVTYLDCGPSLLPGGKVGGAQLRVTCSCLSQTVQGGSIACRTSPCLTRSPTAVALSSCALSWGSIACHAPMHGVDLHEPKDGLRDASRMHVMRELMLGPCTDPAGAHAGRAAPKRGGHGALRAVPVACRGRAHAVAAWAIRAKRLVALWVSRSGQD